MPTCKGDSVLSRPLQNCHVVDSEQLSLLNPPPQGPADATGKSTFDGISTFTSTGWSRPDLDVTERSRPDRDVESEAVAASNRCQKERASERVGEGGGEGGGQGERASERE